MFQYFVPTKAQTYKFDPSDVVVPRARHVTDPSHEAELGPAVRQPHYPVVYAHLPENKINLINILPDIMKFFQTKGK